MEAPALVQHEYHQEDGQPSIGKRANRRWRDQISKQPIGDGRVTTSMFVPEGRRWETGSPVKFRLQASLAEITLASIGICRSCQVNFGSFDLIA